MSKAKTRRMPPRPAAPCLYLGCFSFDEPGDPEQAGSFQIVVEAAHPEQAIERLRSRLRKLRSTTTLFDSPNTIYIDGLIQLTGSFKNGLLVNWESGETPPPPNLRLMCMIPEQKDHGALEFSYDPRGKRRRKGDDTIEPFLDFGGERLRAKLRRAKGEVPDDERHPGNRSSKLPLIPKVVPRANVTQPTPSTAELRRAETRAKKERRAALDATLAEVRRGQ